jgi:colicin import membrane protein
MSEEQKESSVLFSLQELFSLEQDRIRQEEDEKKRRAEAEAQAREEAERRAREEEQTRLLQEEERRRLDEARKREETARLDALRQGEIERARVEAEKQAQIQAMKAQQDHAMQLAVLKEDKHKKNLTIGISIAVGVLVIGGSIGTWQILKAREEAHQQEVLAQIELRKQEDEKRRLQAKLDEQAKKVDELIQQLSEANSDAKRAELASQLAAARAEQDKLKRGFGGPKKPGDTSGPKSSCPPGDPMCGL